MWLYWKSTTFKGLPCQLARNFGVKYRINVGIFYIYFLGSNIEENVQRYVFKPFSAVACGRKLYHVPVLGVCKLDWILKSTNQDLYDDFLNRVSYLKDVEFFKVISLSQCWDPGWFQWGSRSSILGQCISGSRSRSKALMTKNCIKFAAEKNDIFWLIKLQFSYP